MSGCHHHDHGHDRTGWTVALNLTVNLGLTVAKWFAYVLTGSPSLFGEAAHSTADSLNPIFQWIGHRRGQRPACPDHPHGHGRETYFWSLLAALLMLTLGAGFTAWHGIETMLTGRAPERSFVSLAIMAVALMAEGYTFFRAWRELKREGDSFWKRLRQSRNTVLLGILLENFVDTIGVVLAFAGFGLYWLTGNPYVDAVFSLLIAVVLLCSSLFLVARNRSLLVGESVGAAERQRLLQAATHAIVAEVLELEAVAQGPDEVAVRLRVRLHRGRLVNALRFPNCQLSSSAVIEQVIDWQLRASEELRQRLHAVDHRVVSVSVEFR